jgi:hypothetical protein
MKILVAAFLAFTLAACESMPAVEVCYVHPVYGQVCVQVGGKKHYREDLSPAERAEVEKWIKEKQPE